MSAACQPHATIAARNLLQYPCVMSGWLRRQGKLERMTGKLFKPLGIKWRQKLVAVVDGCVYVYKSESSTLPQHAAPLSDYNVVKRAEDDIMPHVSWCFKLEPLESGKTHYFACTCLKHMLEWIYTIKREMLRAHSRSVISLTDVSESDYVQLETPIFAQDEKTKQSDTLQTQWSERPDSEGSGSVCSNDSDYYNIDPNDMDSSTNMPRPLPDVPPDENDETKTTNNNKKYVNIAMENKTPVVTPGAPSAKKGPAAATLPAKKTKPIVTPKPMTQPPKILAGSKPVLPGLQPIHNGPPAIPKGKPIKSPQSPSSTNITIASHLDQEGPDFLYNSDDKDKAAELLDTNTVGTFLVRNSRKSPDIKVLAVKTPNGIKEYQIRNQGNQSSLDGKMMFNTLDLLVRFYKTNKLPTQPMMLSKGYSSTDLSKA